VFSYLPRQKEREGPKATRLKGLLWNSAYVKKRKMPTTTTFTIKQRKIASGDRPFGLKETTGGRGGGMFSNKRKK